MLSRAVPNALRAAGLPEAALSHGWTGTWVDLGKCPSKPSSCGRAAILSVHHPLAFGPPSCAPKPLFRPPKLPSRTTFGQEVRFSANLEASRGLFFWGGVLQGERKSRTFLIWGFMTRLWNRALRKGSEMRKTVTFVQPCAGAAAFGGSDAFGAARTAARQGCACAAGVAAGLRCARRRRGRGGAM